MNARGTENTILGVVRLAITLHCSALNLEQLACRRPSHHTHSRVSLVVGSVQIRYSSSLGFLSPLVVGELAERLRLVLLLAILIVEHLN